MTTYTKSTDFAVKDLLLTGNPNKLVKGSEVNVEFANIELADATNVKRTAASGSATLPAGTTAQRDVSPATGYIRVNTTTNQLEWWNGTLWTYTDSGANNNAIYENVQTILSDTTLTTGKNGMTAGPITINSGVTVTVPTGSNWSII